MADQSYLDILAQGVEAWNSWRKRNPTSMHHPDLTEAKLSGAILSGANLSGANLRRANLIKADLFGANLTGAKLTGADLLLANLTAANFSEASLTGAKLTGAKLSGANLSGASLIGAYLNEANLNGTILKGAKLPEAKLSGRNLSAAILSGADLSYADLSYADLRKAHLSEASLTGASLRKANLTRAKLSGANLSEAQLTGADLTGADLSRRADLTRATLSRANLTEANLSDADLSDANLTNSVLVKTDLQRAILAGCAIYGISAWSLKLEGAKQQNLNVSDYGETAITVDDLEVAQFIHLLLKNENLRDVIETMTSTAVLILGNFEPERKKVLEAIKERLRERGYLPILFDFEGPHKQRLIDTVTTVARLSRFVIADITQPRSVTAELTTIIDSLPLLPIQLLILRPEEPPHAFIQDVVASDSVLKLHRYTSSQDLLASFDEEIIAPADKKRDELEVKRLRGIEEKLRDAHG